MGTFLNTIEAQAAETYSDNWKIDSNQNWWYYMDDGTLAKDAWIEDHGEWYLLGSDGMMRTGVVKSNGGRYYLLDTVRGTGTYGKLLKNGGVYQGITIKAEASGAYEGALSDETIAALRNIGVEVDNVVNVENTKHVSGGKVTSGNNNVTVDNSNNVTEDNSASSVANDNDGYNPNGTNPLHDRSGIDLSVGGSSGVGESDWGKWH
jgi:hypothetical protein